MRNGNCRRACFIFLFSMVHVMNVDSVAGRVLPDESKGQAPSSLHVKWQALEEVDQSEVHGDGENAYMGLGELGSRPPSCQHKCGRCVPCVAIQVPTNTDHDPMHTHYANYEPEGWKCKCGSSFYSP